MERPFVLRSWKEVAGYMGKGVRTVQRWERDFGLPVRRVAGSKTREIMAYAADIDAWVAQRCSTRRKTVAVSKGNPDNLKGYEQFSRLSRENRLLSGEMHSSLRKLRDQIALLRGKNSFKGIP